MIPPFGGPYSALYPHGGVPHMASLVSPEILAKSQRVRKKSKVVDKTSVSVGNGSAESAGANEDRMSHRVGWIWKVARVMEVMAIMILMVARTKLIETLQTYRNQN
ncbi:Common plant regulatory factor 1 [Apostasia shenzhenica]|uniref:Common plant regulatory factor 1 n=1 Tax=Apostasia shenzhenica TaxID=1088818 RepID=A0A2I0AK24_9ASPA|nr:Common plant regulatory factor 1 [Apostasia shenzhenica]